MFIFQTALCAFLCQSLVKEIFLLKFIDLKRKKILEGALLAYFLFVFCFIPSFILFLAPCIFLIFLFVFLKKKEEKDILFQLHSLLLPLESQMKLGYSFINSWQKGLEALKSEKNKQKIQKMTEILNFQDDFQHPDKEIENFIKDLMLIRQSASPLQRLRHLQRKVKIEQAFQTKSKRALLQIRIQSGLLSFFYVGILIWTIVAYGRQYIYLILISALLFSLGLLWIFKAGRKMKWSV